MAVQCEHFESLLGDLREANSDLAELLGETEKGYFVESDSYETPAMADAVKCRISDVNLDEWREQVLRLIGKLFTLRRRQEAAERSLRIHARHIEAERISNNE